MSNFDDDDVPPLEDMTPVIERVKKMSLKESTNQTATNGGGPLQENKQHKERGDEKVRAVEEVKSKKVFGGLQKGFLLGSSAPKKKSSPARKVQSKSNNTKFDYEVKLPSKSQSNSLVLNDVQKAMEGSQPSQEWLNDDVLNKVQSDEDLLKQLNNPKFGEAIELMKRNPKEALERYKHDHEVAEFFKKFYGILGNHFSKLAADQDEKREVVTQAPTQPHLMTQEEKQVQQILGNSELRAILEKPDIMQLIKTLKENPDQAQTMLRSGNMEMKSDVRKLIAAGVLNIQ